MALEPAGPSLSVAYVYQHLISSVLGLVAATRERFGVRKSGRMFDQPVKRLACANAAERFRGFDFFRFARKKIGVPPLSCAGCMGDGTSSFGITPARDRPRAQIAV
jgi:hypothetical protein